MPLCFSSKGKAGQGPSSPSKVHILHLHVQVINRSWAKGVDFGYTTGFLPVTAHQVNQVTEQNIYITTIIVETVKHAQRVTILWLQFNFIEMATPSQMKLLLVPNFFSLNIPPDQSNNWAFPMTR